MRWIRWYLLAWGVGSLLMGCGPESIEQACRQKHPNAECCADSDCGARQFCYVDGVCGAPPISPGPPCKVTRGDFKCHDRCEEQGSCPTQGEVCASAMMMRGGDVGLAFRGCFAKDALPQ